MLNANISQRVKRITNLPKSDMTFLESSGIKYEEDIMFLLYENILKNIPLVTQRKLGLICEY